MESSFRKKICNISENTDNTIYGFDSFEGLHEDWDNDNPKGIYSLNGKLWYIKYDDGNKTILECPQKNFFYHIWSTFLISSCS